MTATQAELLRQLSLDRDAPPGRGAGADGGGARRGWIWIVLALAAVAGMAFWWWQRHAAAAALPVRIVTARSATAAPAASGSVLDASGYVVARRAATVSAKITGKVRDVLIEEGQKVEEGQVLAHLDEVNARAQLDLADAQTEQSRAQAAELQVSLTNAERDRRRQSDLLARKLVAQAALDNADTAVGQFRARLASVQKGVTVSRQQAIVAQRNVDDTVIRAPFTGVITQKNAQPGEMISPLSGGGSSFTRSGIGTLVDMNSQEIEVDVAESFIGKVVSGAPVTIKLNAYPDVDFPGHVIAIVPTADRAKATVKVRVGFERGKDGTLDPRILPEMGARVSFLAAESAKPTGVPKPGVYVPLEAVTGSGADAHVFVVGGDGVVHRLAVKPAEREGNELRIPAGLAAGAELAIATGLADGRHVVRSDAAAP